MRIAAKRLRYTLELARPHRSPELDAIADKIKRVQTLLGEIHDCDIWAENLDAFARTEAEQIHVFFGDSRRFNRLLPGIDYLRKDRKGRREQCFSRVGGILAGTLRKACLGAADRTFEIRRRGRTIEQRRRQAISAGESPPRT